MSFVLLPDADGIDEPVVFGNLLEILEMSDDAAVVDFLAAAANVDELVDDFVDGAWHPCGVLLHEMELLHVGGCDGHLASSE